MLFCNGAVFSFF